MSYLPDHLRQQVTTRSLGRCEYCRMHSDFVVKRHEVDHVYAEKHGGPTLTDNLCLSCLICNRYKGSDLCSLDPETGELSALFHPRRDAWEDHFRLTGPRIIGLTPQGRVTAKLLRFNDEERLLEREFLIRSSLYP